MNHASTMPYVIVSIHCESSLIRKRCVLLIYIVDPPTNQDQPYADDDEAKPPVSVCFGFMLSTLNPDGHGSELNYSSVTTHKEHLSRILHSALSSSSGPWFSIFLFSLPPSVIEFGHEP